MNIVKKEFGIQRYYVVIKNIYTIYRKNEKSIHVYI